MRSAPRGDAGTAEHSLRQDERGSVTAEFAIVLPAVLVVLGLVIGGVALSAHRITLVSSAADAARLEARGESAEARLTELGAGVQIERRTEQGLHCVELASAPLGGILAAITIRVHSCAAVSDVGALEG